MNQQKYRIAVVGCGIAGATVSFLLAEQGHVVTMFEQAPECRPVGAGIMVQTSGQQVLQRIGLLDSVQAVSQKLEGMTAVLGNGRTLVRLNFARLSSPRQEVYSLGVHRGELFQRLLARCRTAGVHIQNSFSAEHFDTTRGQLRSAQNETAGPFDFLIVADGSRSRLREGLGFNSRVTEYKYGALWTTGHCDYQPDRLYQVVDGTQRLVGLLPIGLGRCSYFWGLPVSGWPALAESNFEHWRETAIAACPPSESILGSLQSFKDLTFGSYRSVALRVPFNEKAILIGDAAHATSPHLGQGANLALEDAECFADCLAKSTRPSDAFGLFHQQRYRKVRFYRQLTAMLSPFFQSDETWRGPLRNLCLPVMPALPWVGRQMLLTLSGQKRGWW